MFDRNSVLKRVFGIRFGKPFPEHWALNDFIKNQLCRSTHRNFIDKPLNPELLEALMAAAQSSPTSGTFQNYSVMGYNSGLICCVIAITDKNVLSKFYSSPRLKNILGKDADPLNVQALETCSVFLIWLADLHRTDVILQELKKQDPTIPEEVMDQPNTAEYQLKGIIDATIAAQTLVMCAESMGLGTMYCGWLRQMPIEFLEEEFNLPNLTVPLFVMCIGYPRMQRSISVRYNTETILHYNQYKDINGLEDISGYIERYDLKNKTRREDQKTFKDVMVNRLSFDKSKEWVSSALKHMGFKFK